MNFVTIQLPILSRLYNILINFQFYAHKFQYRRPHIQNTEKYNRPLCLEYVVYTKTFDTVEIWAVLDSLLRCQIDCRYIEVLKSVNAVVTMTIRVQGQNTRRIQLRRGFRQGDLISLKLHTNALEDVSSCSIGEDGVSSSTGTTCHTFELQTILLLCRYLYRSLARC